MTLWSGDDFASGEPFAAPRAGMKEGSVRASARLLVIAASAALLMASPLAASAAAPEVYVFQGGFTMVDAIFVTTDASGCISTATEVEGINSRAINPGVGPQWALTASVTVLRWTTCGPYQVLLDEGTAGIYAGATLVGAPALTNEALHAMLLMHDTVGGRVSAMWVDLAWTCPKPAIPVPSRFQEHGWQFTTNLHSLTRLNYGCVASGSVHDPWEEFAPSSTTNAFVVSAQSGEVQIHR